ncbi:MAG: class I SAM-dependent methyltransferase [Cyanobacteria bacterium P01_A01_bin.84]
MDKNFYLQYAAVEDKHWWFVGRRTIINKIISQLALPKNSSILEVGCGTGGNLQMLGKHGRLSAMEIDKIACEIANKRQVCQVLRGSLPEKIPFNMTYDLIVMLDVLEHIDDDWATLKALHNKLHSNGWLLITVPAYQFLWSKHDEINHHKRRYLLKNLTKLVKNAGYTVNYCSYFNSILFPLVFGIRYLQKFLPQKDSTFSNDLTLPSPLINKLLSILLKSEINLMNKFSLPFGVSILLLAKKNDIAHPKGINTSDKGNMNYMYL